MCFPHKIHCCPNDYFEYKLNKTSNGYLKPMEFCRTMFLTDIVFWPDLF